MPPVPPPPPRDAPIVAARRIAGSSAFDLVTGTAGTFIAWGAPAEDGGGVRVRELGPLGAARGNEIDIASGSHAAPGVSEGGPYAVIEVAAATRGAHVGVAWTVLAPGGARAEAAYAAAAPQFAPPVDLGEMEPGVGGRGNVLVASLGDGGLYVAHRITRGPCHAASGMGSAGTVGCARFARTQLPGGTDVRGDGASEVALPCTPLLPGAISGTASTDPWFYGVCHVDESPATTVFVINPNPAGQYAAATDVLAGCLPRSIARAESGVIVRARCGDEDAIARVDPLGHATHELRHAGLSVRCDDGRPTLSARDHDAQLAHRLTESESRVEAWLPRTIAPEGSRAVWTGEALLVATSIGSSAAPEVSLRRYQCRGAELARTSLPPY